MRRYFRRPSAFATPLRAFLSPGGPPVVRSNVITPLPWYLSGFVRMASTLPRLPVFEAISRHDPESTVAVHSLSGRRFKYGQLLGDVCKTRNNLHEAAGRDNIDGERIAFLVENSYDYVGKQVSTAREVISMRCADARMSPFTY